MALVHFSFETSLFDFWNSKLNSSLRKTRPFKTLLVQSGPLELFFPAPDWVYGSFNCFLAWLLPLYRFNDEPFKILCSSYGTSSSQDIDHQVKKNLCSFDSVVICGRYRKNACIGCFFWHTLYTYTRVYVGFSGKHDFSKHHFFLGANFFKNISGNTVLLRNFFRHVYITLVDCLPVCAS